jgi:hypothetical protein
MVLAGHGEGKDAGAGRARPRARGGQFGLVSIDDPGSGPVTVTLSGRTDTGAEVMRHRFASPRPPA